MTWIIEHWELIISLLCMAIVIVENIIMFYEEPNDKKIASVKEWLLWAVTMAEKEYGSGTGVLKLRYVWNLACNTFTWLPKIITFDMFSNWVDEALAWLKVQLESNESVKGYVEGESND